MSRIYQYPEATELQEDDVMLIDRNGAESAKSILVSKVAPALMSKTITERGTYKASDDDVSGYNEVDVDIPYTDIHVATGAIASFEGEDLPLKSLKCNIDLVQTGSGDPSPENVRPFVGWSGANITNSPLNISPLYNGQVSGDGTYMSSTWRLTNVSSTQDNSYFLKAGTYTLDYDKLNPNATDLTKCIILSKDSNYNIVDNFAAAWNNIPFNFTLTEDAYIYITFRAENVDLDINDYRIKLLGDNYSISFGQTVYEGVLDVTGGVLTVTKVKSDLYLLDWVYQSNNSRFYVASPSDLLRPSDNAQAFNGSCSAYLVSPYAEHGDNSIAVTTTGSMFIFDTDYTDATALKTFLQTNNVQLVYALATPITIQLSPTQVRSLAGDNNIFSNTGDVDVEYQTVWVRPSA